MAGLPFSSNSANFHQSVDFSEQRFYGGAETSVQNSTGQGSGVEVKSASQAVPNTQNKGDTDSPSGSNTQAGANVPSMSGSASDMPGKVSKKSQPEVTRKICCCGMKDEALCRFWRYCILVILCVELYFVLGAVAYMWISMYSAYSSVYFPYAAIYATIIIPLLLGDFSIEIRRLLKKKQHWIEGSLCSLRATRICLILAAVITVYACCLLDDRDFVAGISHTALQMIVTVLAISSRILENLHLKKIQSMK